MISFLAATEEDAIRLVAETKIWKLAESLGGVESLIEHPAQMTHASTAERALRRAGQPRAPLGRDRVSRRPDRRPRAGARSRRRQRLLAFIVGGLVVGHHALHREALLDVAPALQRVDARRPAR